MTAESYMSATRAPRNEVYMDTLERLRKLTLEITLKLGAYADIKDEHLFQVGSACNAAINYFGRKDYDKVENELAKINCGSFQPKMEEYEEALTYYQDQWKLEIIGIWLSIKFLKEKDFSKAIVDQIETNRLIHQINDYYNRCIGEMLKSWDL